MDSESESKLISLTNELISVNKFSYHNWYSISGSKLITLIIQIISLVNSMDFDSQPKPESELMSLTKQVISLINSMDLNTQPWPLRGLISLFTQNNSRGHRMDMEFESLIGQALRFEPEPELLSLIHQIASLVISMNPEWKNLISLCPQIRVRYEQGKFHVVEEASSCINNISKWDCHPLNWRKFCMPDLDSHFLCRGCNGNNHEEYDKAPLEIYDHLLHPEHSLQLVLLKDSYSERTCYYCLDVLREVFYYCSPCDLAIDLECLQIRPLLSINHPNWHWHTLALFPRHASLTCSLCGLDDLTSPIYMCPPCDFVVHLKCLNLPSVIRISRHLHRISFTFSFNQGNWYCHVCRKKINNDYGGYSCIKEGCSYVAHSRCATQSNVWDGKELKGMPEQDIEEVKPFVRISDGIIHHFSHQQHHLKLDENTGRDYDDKKFCQACSTPIYFGNFYFCMQCDYILHEECANLSQQRHSPIHPHMLTLVGGYDGVMEPNNKKCSACYLICTSGLFYVCPSKDCKRFRLHIQCATISEPTVHGSHMHPLFLTSKPKEERICWVCEEPRGRFQLKESFNCIECDFALCLRCATLPQKVRYKHDKHTLTLSYGKETSIMTSWCEICEKQINPEKRFYACDEYCCVTIHVECLIGRDFYMQPGSSFLYYYDKVHVLSNNHHMSRPICFRCDERCLGNIVFRCFGSIFCSKACLYYQIMY